MSPLQPGEWSMREEEETDHEHQQEKYEFLPTQSTELIKIYQSLAEAVRVSPEIIYHPCCETDVSPSAAFPGKRVVYVDLNTAAMAALQKAGYDALCTSALEFQPEKEIDLLILLNPAISVDKIVAHVKKGGHVICNNYHETANDMMKMPDFSPVAVALTCNRDQMIIDTTNPADYLTQVQDDEEFEKTDSKTFAEAKRIVGEVRSVLAAYSEFLEDGLVFWGSVMKGDQNYNMVPTKKEAYVDDFFMFKRTAKIQKS